jgi:hypothetical protein
VKSLSEEVKSNARFEACSQVHCFSTAWIGEALHPFETSVLLAIRGRDFKLSVLETNPVSGTNLLRF